MQNHHFKNPPIVEVICGIQFDCSKFNFAMVDRFYNKVKDTYPTCAENMPLPFTYDKLSLSAPPAARNKPIFVRYFFINESNTKLIQLQDGRLLFNWRKNEGADTTYPKFDAVYQEFLLHMKAFFEIVSDANAEFSQTQLELTYLDHILFSDFDNKSWALPKIFTFFAKNPLGTDIDDSNFSIQLPIENLSGHLQMVGRSGIRNTDKKAVFILETTVRGNTNKSVITIDSWFGKAHSAVYQAFNDSITEDAKKVWGYFV
jgi:uncharacterized protein (TIGR04255 family)